MVKRNQLLSMKINNQRLYLPFQHCIYLLKAHSDNCCEIQTFIYLLYNNKQQHYFFLLYKYQHRLKQFFEIMQQALEASKEHFQFYQKFVSILLLKQKRILFQPMLSLKLFELLLGFQLLMKGALLFYIVISYLVGE